MSEHTPDAQPPAEESLARGYEVVDVRSGPLVLSATVLAAAVAVVLALLSWFIGWLETGAKRHDPALSPLIGSQLPPEPRLQTAPADDLARMRAAEHRALESYRWIDKKEGIVQLPIDRAMDLLLEQGLPETSAEVPRVEPAEGEKAADEKADGESEERR